jgi:Ner family transcriptional regulator
MNITPPISVCDWHPWDIKAALAKKGYSFARIAKENNYARTSPNDVLRRPSTILENIVASIIGVNPWDIWPSRYDSKHQPLRNRRGSKKAA